MEDFKIGEIYKYEGIIFKVIDILHTDFTKYIKYQVLLNDHLTYNEIINSECIFSIISLMASKSKLL